LRQAQALEVLEPSSKSYPLAVGNPVEPCQQSFDFPKIELKHYAAPQRRDLILELECSAWQGRRGLVFVLEVFMLKDDLLPGAKAAADYSGLTQRQIYHLVEGQHLTAIRMGKRLYFRRSELDRAFSTNAAA
jgi:excisionase family DNA binding protein